VPGFAIELKTRFPIGVPLAASHPLLIVGDPAQQRAAEVQEFLGVGRPELLLLVVSGRERTPARAPEKPFTPPDKEDPGRGRLRRIPPHAEAVEFHEA
jgi:hypothetical protein